MFTGESHSLIEEGDIHSLYVEANHGALVMDLLWAVWSLMQVHLSSNNFDYLEYGVLRYCHYRTLRDTVF